MMTSCAMKIGIVQAQFIRFFLFLVCQCYLLSLLVDMLPIDGLCVVDLENFLCSLSLWSGVDFGLDMINGIFFFFFFDKTVDVRHPASFSDTFTAMHISTPLTDPVEQGIFFYSQEQNLSADNLISIQTNNSEQNLPCIQWWQGPVHSITAAASSLETSYINPNYPAPKILSPLKLPFARYIFSCPCID